MRSKAIAWLWVLFLLVGVTSGCERSGTSSGNGGGGSATTQNASDEGAIELEVVPITPLLPRLATHFALDTRGNLYWIQESERPEPGGDLVFAMGESGVPQAVPELTPARILALAGHPKGTGAVKSLAAGPGDDLYAYFVGGDGRTPVVALVRYEPGRRVATIAASAEQLMRDSGLGVSIELARGTLAANGGELWLWLRGAVLGEASALMRVTPAAGGGAGVELRRVVPQVQLSEVRRAALVMDAEQEDLAAGPKGSVYYTDRRRACLWRIENSGVATRLQSIEGLSLGVSTPSVDDSGWITVIAGESERLFSREGSATPMDWAQLRYPALVQFEATGKVRTIGARDIHGPTNLSLQNLQPRGLIMDRGHGGWVTFDASSGELLQLKLKRR